MPSVFGKVSANCPGKFGQKQVAASRNSILLMKQNGHMNPKTCYNWRKWGIASKSRQCNPAWIFFISLQAIGIAVASFNNAMGAREASSQYSPYI